MPVTTPVPHLFLITSSVLVRVSRSPCPAHRGSRKTSARRSRTLNTMASHRAHLSTFGAERRHFEHFLEGDLLTSFSAAPSARGAGPSYIRRRHVYRYRSDQPSRLAIATPSIRTTAPSVPNAVGRAKPLEAGRRRHRPAPMLTDNLVAVESPDPARHGLCRLDGVCQPCHSGRFDTRAASRIATKPRCHLLAGTLPTASFRAHQASRGSRVQPPALGLAWTSLRRPTRHLVCRHPPPSRFTCSAH